MDINPYLESHRKLQKIESYVQSLILVEAKQRAKELDALIGVVDVLKKQMDAIQQDVLGLARLVGKLDVAIAMLPMNHELSTDLSTGIGQKREQSDQNEDST